MHKKAIKLQYDRITSIQVEGLTFKLIVEQRKESLYVDNHLVSEMNSWRGGNHKFDYGGNSYQLKVIPGFTGIHFKIIKNQ